MVSIDARNQFIEEVRSSPTSCFALAMVFGEECKSIAPATVADRTAFAIIKNNKAAFADVVEELQSRRIKADADWVLDDFLLFALLVGAKKFRIGDQLCRSIIGQRRPTNELDAAFNAAISSLLHDAFAIEGAFSFAKLVFCSLTGQLRIDKSVARTIYGELTKQGLLEELSTFPKLLAYRSFDLLVQEGIENNLDSVDEIVSAIQTHSATMSIGDWVKIVLALRPSAIAWIIGVLMTICAAIFSAGIWFATLSETSEAETPPNSKSLNDISVPDKNEESRDVTS